MKRSERQQMKTAAERDMTVYKRDDMIQKSRFVLTVQEQRCILYAISKIKLDDTYLTEYTFDMKDFYALCGLENQSYSYTRLKKQLITLKSKCWWLQLPDGGESAVSWFEVVRLYRNSGKVVVKFHEDMMPYLLELAKQAQLGNYYTGYSLKYVLPMSSQYSPRLYELLKSYQKNNREWFFGIDDLKKALDCHYKNFYDFRRYVLEPAVKEINKYTDLKIAYATEKEGRKVARITFYMAKKQESELSMAEQACSEALDGQIDIFSLLNDGNGDQTVKDKLLAEDFWGDQSHSNK